jgi:CBS domain-containing protein
VAPDPGAIGTVPAVRASAYLAAETVSPAAVARPKERTIMRVRDVMSKPAVVVAPETPVKHAAELLDERGFTCLPVVDSDGKLVGAVSEADLLMNRFPPDPRIPLVERREREAGAAVCDVMSEEVLTADPQDQVSDLLAVLHTSGHRSVPVVQAGIVIGVVTYRDLVHALARDDSLIAADVQRRLDLYGSPGRWTVSVHDGEVTLGDAPADPVARGVALRVAESVLGVTRCRFVG